MNNIIKLLLIIGFSWFFGMSLLLAGLWLPLLFVSLLFLILIIFIYRNTIVPIFIYLGSIYYFPRNICIYILKIPFYFNRLIYPFAILPLYLKEVVKNKRVIPRISLNRWLFAFIIIQLLSIVVNIGNLQFSQGFSSINRFSSTFFECILVFYLTIFIINDEDKFKRMLNFIVISGGIISFYGLIELILRRNIIYDLAHYIGFREFNLGGTGPREGFARIRSFMLHPLELGCVLNMMLPFQYVKYIHSKGTSKMFYFLIILISTIAIIATVSRGAYLVLFIEMLLILILICRTRSVFIYLFYSVMFLMIFIFFNESLIKISNLFTPNYLSYDTSIKARLSDYPIIFAMLKKDIIFGSGLGTISTDVLFVDNYFLKIFGECGVLGLAIYLLIFIRFLIYPIRCIIKSNYNNIEINRDIFLCFFISILGFFITTFYMDSFTFTAAVNTFWIIVALMVAKNEKLKNCATL